MQEVGLKVKFEREIVDAIINIPNARNKIRNNDVPFIKAVKKLILNAQSSWRFESLSKACRRLEVNSKHFVETETGDKALDDLFTREYKIYQSIKTKHKKQNEKLNAELQELEAGGGDLSALLKTKRLREQRERMMARPAVARADAPARVEGRYDAPNPFAGQWAAAPAQPAIEPDFEIDEFQF